jgi:outer membrane protein
MKFSRTTAFVILIISLTSIVLFQSFIHQKSDIVYVDSEKLLSNYTAMIDARKEFNKKKEVWKANIDSLASQVQDGIKKYEKIAVGGSEKERLMAKEIISNRQRQLYDYQTALKQKASEEEQEKTQSVLSSVNTYLLKYGKQHKYRLILIASGGNIAYAEEGIDITDKIVEALNKEYSIPVK